MSEIEKINEIIASIEGTIGVAAWPLAENAGKAPILINAETIFPTASTVKIPILYELYRQADTKRVDLNQRVAILEEHLVPGSGVLQDLALELNPTIHDLAVLMIVVSDNTATDILLELLGQEQVEKTMLELGLKQTQICITVREILYSLAGLDVNDPTHTYQMARQILENPAHKAPPDCRALGETDNDVSSPHDLAQLLTLIARYQVLNKAACDEMLDVLTRQKFNQVIPLHLPPGTKIAHKTGSIGGVRNDAGVVFAPKQPYVVALMSKGLKNEVDGSQKLARISEQIYNYYVN